MEGTSPHSAIEFGALSSHAGVVLLAGTMPLWSAFPSARIAMAVVGLLTAVVAGIVSKVRADRKGATAYATAATIGLIYCVLGAGADARARELPHGAVPELPELDPGPREPPRRPRARGAEADDGAGDVVPHGLAAESLRQRLRHAQRPAPLQQLRIPLGEGPGLQQGAAVRAHDVPGGAGPGFSKVQQY